MLGGAREATLRGAQAPTMPAIVFVSRAIPAVGTIYWDVPRGMPGVSAYSRYEVAAPGALIVREPSGALRTLVDGSQPASTPYNLVDVNAPDVSWDGQSIVFAGLPQAPHALGPLRNPGAWRLFVIRADGTGLRQLTVSDRVADLSQFGSLASSFTTYDDTDPAWLPDGRIVFSSTRWPGFAMYGGARSTNLFVVGADGTGLHRITSEKNGADRPVVDPITGRIVYSRWWRNFRVASNDLSSVPAPGGGYRRHLGLLSALDLGLGGFPGTSPSNLQRNAWQLATIRPDGSDLLQFSGESGLFFEAEDRNHAYGGSFAPDGSFYANFFPMKNGTEASGFGGVRRFPRGPGASTAVLGVTSNLGQRLASLSPPSYGVYVGSYAADPLVLADGRLVVSWAAGVDQDYGLYSVDPGSTGLTPLVDVPGRTELRARLLAPRAVPPILADAVTAVASSVPPGASGPFDVDGTFVFDALNVFFNAPVDVPIVNAPGLGAAAQIAFFLDHQRAQPGSYERLDWPVLLGTAPVAPDGSIPPTPLPANLPMFEQLRGADLTVPLTGRGVRGATTGAAHVAGLNFGRPGQRARCVGCHAGHTMIPVPATDEAARWTNLAPGARILTSSVDPALPDSDGLVDRRAMTGRVEWYWRSHPAQAPNGQWVALQFPQRIRVRTVRLYNPPPDPTLTTVVQAARVRLFADDGGQREVASATTGPVAVGGTDVTFPDVPAQLVGVEFLDVSGFTRSMRVASLSEVEVIARADAGGSCTPPSAPGTLTTSVTGAIVSLSWTPPLVGAAEGYMIEAGSAPGLANLAALPLAAAPTSFTTPAPNGRYYVRVRATTSCGGSAPSNEVVVDVPAACTAPSPPSLGASVAGGLVSLAWTPVGGAAGFRLEAGSAPGASDLYVGTVMTNGLTAAPPPGRYYVRVRAMSACGALSAASADVLVVVP